MNGVLTGGVVRLGAVTLGMADRGAARFGMTGSAVTAVVGRDVSGILGMSSVFWRVLGELLEAKRSS